jgi:HNH endonuclease
MTTHASQFRDVIMELITATAPETVSLKELYAAAEKQITFDSTDLIPPTHHGKSVAEPAWKRNLRNVLQRLKKDRTLVNARRNAWRFPTPDPTTELDPTSAWRYIQQNAHHGLAEAADYVSYVRGQRYRIGVVLEDGLTILRLDSPDPTTLSRGEVERAIGYLNAAGGRVGRRTLQYEVAKEVMMVELHPQLRWDEHTDSIVAMGGGGAPLPVYRDFGEAPNDNPADLGMFARRVRRGQPRFRANLLNLYEGRCAVSGWGPEEVLEAAHIDLHSGTGNNRKENGLLLRADLHTLFDAGLLRINPETFEVVLSEPLRNTPYGIFHATRLRPRIDGTQPGREHLRRRWSTGANLLL